MCTGISVRLCRRGVCRGEVALRAIGCTMKVCSRRVKRRRRSCSALAGRARKAAGFNARAAEGAVTVALTTSAAWSESVGRRWVCALHCHAMRVGTAAMSI